MDCTFTNYPLGLSFAVSEDNNLLVIAVDNAASKITPGVALVKINNYPLHSYKFLTLLDNLRQGNAILPVTFTFAKRETEDTNKVIY